MAKKNGYLCYKFTSPGTSGMPDRVLIGHGSTLFVETKAPGKDPRKLQDYMFGQIRKYGGVVFVARTIEAVDEMFDALKEKA